MRLSWRMRLAQQPELRDLQAWPPISIDSLPQARRKGFLRNQQVLAKVLAGQPLQEVAKAHHLSPGRISQILERCLGGEAEDPPALLSGLIPYGQVQARTRQHPLPTLAEPSGANCAFHDLLYCVPTLASSLDAMLQAKMQDKAYAQKLTPEAFHGEFKRVLAEAQWPKDKYPYTSESLAYETLRLYMHRRQRKLALNRKAPRPKRPARATCYRALRAVQIDEQILDLRSRMTLLLNDELVPLRLARASVMVATDVDTGCILGFLLVPARAPDHRDLLTLLDNCLKPWQAPPLLTSGLQYSPQACFPSGLPEAFPISFGEVQLDNALMHQAHAVTHFLCDKMGATVHFGPPARPTIRRVVETAFSRLNRLASHRFASTTGSHPGDVQQESAKNRKCPPLVDFHTFNEILNVVLTHYNVTPQAALGNASPLAVFRHHCEALYMPYVPSIEQREWQPLLGEEVRPVHWNRREKRQPHINFYFARYQGPGLEAALLKDRQVRVRFDHRDIRTLQILQMDGTSLGEVTVSRSWQRFPHSLATRQLIHKHCKTHRRHAHDPLAQFFRYLLANKGNEEFCLKLLRVYDDYSLGWQQAVVMDLDKPEPALDITSNSNQLAPLAPTQPARQRRIAAIGNPSDLPTQKISTWQATRSTEATRTETIKRSTWQPTTLTDGD